MKRILQFTASLAILLTLSTTLAAQTLKEFFNNTELQLTYLGIDYTKNKLINNSEANTYDIKNKLYQSINELVVNEPRNYDVSAAFRKTNVSKDLSAMKTKNDRINADDIPSMDGSDFSRLKEADIAASVRELSLGKPGIGLVFVMEGMKHEGKKRYGAVWVTLIDMKSKKVLMTERFEMEATGAGFRNMWASVIKKTLNAIEKKKYKEWKEKYGV